jgi:hypothetical protein
MIVSANGHLGARSASDRMEDAAQSGRLRSRLNLLLYYFATPGYSLSCGKSCDNFAFDRNLGKQSGQRQDMTELINGESPPADRT